MARKNTTATVLDRPTVDEQMEQQNLNLGVCRKCGVNVTEENKGSVSREGKHTCAACLAPPAADLTAQNALAASLAANTKPVGMVPLDQQLTDTEKKAKNAPAKTAPEQSVVAIPAEEVGEVAPTDAKKLARIAQLAQARAKWQADRASGQAPKVKTPKPPAKAGRLDDLIAEMELLCTRMTVAVEALEAKVAA